MINTMSPRKTWASDASRAADVDHAVKVFGNPTSLGIVRHLSTVERANYGSLCKALSISASAISTHLRGLEVAGAIVGDLPAGERVGRSVNYSLNPDRIRLLSAALLNYALGFSAS